MASVFIPPQMRDLTGGVQQLQIEARNVRQAVLALEEAFPGRPARLVPQDRLAPGLAVSVDGELSNRGLLAPLEPESEVHFLPALGGG